MSGRLPPSVPRMGRYARSLRARVSFTEGVVPGDVFVPAQLAPAPVGARRRRGVVAAALAARRPRQRRLHASANAAAQRRPGQGACFQADAFNGFKNVFLREAPTGCSAAGNAVTYRRDRLRRGPRGAGRARAPTTHCKRATPAIRWAGTDEPPTPTQRTQIETGPIDANGLDVTAADNGKLHVDPGRASARNAVIVNLPGPAAPASARPSSSASARRPRSRTSSAPGTRAGGRHVGRADPGVCTPAASCADQPIKRVVRLDSSGTTFAFKHFLHQIDPTHVGSARQHGVAEQRRRDRGPARGRQRRRPARAKVRRHRRARSATPTSPTARGGACFTLTTTADVRQDVLAADPAPKGSGDLRRSAGSRQRLQEGRPSARRELRDGHAAQYARPTRSATGRRSTRR